MAGAVAMMVAGAAVNALAFSGSNYYFSKLDKEDNEDVKEERKRHNNAVEQMRAAHDAWSQKRYERLDWIKEKLREQKHAVRNFHDAEAAWCEYTRITGEILDTLEPEPQLSDFYTPSSAQKDREIAFVIGGMIVTGLVTYYITRR